MTTDGDDSQRARSKDVWLGCFLTALPFHTHTAQIEMSKQEERQKRVRSTFHDQQPPLPVSAWLPPSLAATYQKRTGNEVTDRAGSRIWGGSLIQIPTSSLLIPLPCLQSKGCSIFAEPCWEWLPVGSGRRKGHST